MAPTLHSATAPGRSRDVIVENEGHRSLRRDGWEAVTRHEPRTPFSEDRWELFDMAADPTQLVDLAEREPQRLAEMIGADEALACGYLHQLAGPDEIEAATADLVQRLTALAPVTQRVSKQTLSRLVQHSVPEAEDLIRLAYGSQDFHEGVSAFVAKRKPHWKGR